ncbi:MAG: hypothetical protein HY360_22330 [Verrucomicrobia bacterium]|nr:hypothetical protein [Verrucomicrobiota bacterium]
MVKTYYGETVVSENGKLTLDHLPFSQGESVRIVVAQTKGPSGKRDALRGTVLKYERPFDPVALDDWEATA